MENALYGNACPPQESRRFSLYRRAADFASMNLPNCVFPQLLRTARRSAADMCIFSRIFIDFPFFLFFQKRACIFRTGVLYYFPKRIIRLREYLHCCFSPDKTDRSRPGSPSRPAPVCFFAFLQGFFRQNVKNCGYIERFPQFVILTRRDGFRYNLKYSLY